MLWLLLSGKGGLTPNNSHLAYGLGDTENGTYDADCFILTEYQLHCPIDVFILAAGNSRSRCLPCPRTTVDFSTERRLAEEVL